MSNRLDIFNEIHQERKAQDEKWGEQNHSPENWLSILMEEVGEVARAMIEKKFNIKEKGNYREELVQCAAVLVSMVECFDRLEEYRKDDANQKRADLNEISF